MLPSKYQGGADWSGHEAPRSTRTFETEAEAKAFFQGVSSISNVLVSVDSLKVEARVAGADVLNWSAMFFKVPYSTATFVPFLA